MRIVILYSLLFLHASLLQSQDAKIIEISTDQQGNLDFKAIDQLKEDLKEADIVLIGETIHTPLYYPSKIQLVKYLHRNLGFDVLAFESGLYEMERVNRDIAEGQDVSIAFDRGLFAIWTNSFEFEELYTYLDSVRQSGKRLDITGFDCQVSGSNAADYFVPELKKILIKNKIKYDSSDLAILQEQITRISNGVFPDSTCTETFLKRLQKLSEDLKPHENLSLLHQSFIGILGQLNELYFNKIEQKFKTGQFRITDNNMRDSLMAMQMMYLYNHRYSGRKIIGWGANMHFGNHLDSLKTKHSTAGYKPMGLHLKNTLGKKVYILFVTTNLNVPGTIEWALATKKTENAFIPNAFLKQNRIASAGVAEHLLDMEKTDMSNLTDGILIASIHAPSDKRSSSPLQGIILDAVSKQPIELASIALTNSTEGTVTDENGKFSLEQGTSSANATVIVSCIGYKSKKISLSSLRNSKGEFKIQLIPELSLLQEVIVREKALDAKEIFGEMLRKVPDNYAQSPFNMEFYSNILVNDTIGDNHYQLESIIRTYHDGYKKGSLKSHLVIQKRERGTPFWQGKKSVMKLWPVVEIAFNELYSEEINENLYDEEFRDKINLKLLGTKFLNNDTVFVLSYEYGSRGEFYIDANTYALVRHVTTFTSRTARNRAELNYEKRDGYYFPSSALGEYLHVYKVDRKKRSVNIRTQAILKELTLDSVSAFNQNYDLWRVEEVPYNKEYWIKRDSSQKN